jgi:hypothetical protein
VSIRVIYTDDEADILDVAALSLGLDPDIEVCTCASGAELLGPLPGGVRTSFCLTS